MTRLLEFRQTETDFSFTVGTWITGISKLSPTSLKKRNGRKQKVYVRGDSTDASGSPLICVYTVCAPATKANYEYALRYNMRMSFGALAVNDHGENSYLVIVDTLLAQAAQPIALRKSIDSVAKHGDKMEQSLTGQDVQ